MAAPKQTDPQFKLRMPQALKNDLDRAVEASGRTLNAEIVWRLEASFSTWPRVSVDEWIMERVNAASPALRVGAEAQINTLVEGFLDKQFPDPLSDANGVLNQFSRLLWRAPEQLRPGLRQEMEKLVRSVLDAEDATHLTQETDANGADQ